MPGVATTLFFFLSTVINMEISLENRCRIVLLLFFIIDHLVWISGDYLEHAALFYVVLSECVRLFALFAFIAGFYNIKFLETGILTIMAYSVIMLPLDYYGAQDVGHLTGEPMPNVLWFKKNSTIPVESDGGFYYICVILFTYMFAAKHIEPEIIKKDSGSGGNLWNNDKGYDLFLALSILVGVILCICYILFP